MFEYVEKCNADPGTKDAILARCLNTEKDLKLQLEMLSCSCKLVVFNKGSNR